jgi:hypothetical protein
MLLPKFDPKTISADDPDALRTRRDTTTLATPGAASQRDPDVSSQKRDHKRTTVRNWKNDDMAGTKTLQRKLSKMKPRKKQTKTESETESETERKLKVNR